MLTSQEIKVGLQIRELGVTTSEVHHGPKPRRTEQEGAGLAAAGRLRRSPAASGARGRRGGGPDVRSSPFRSSGPRQHPSIWRVFAGSPGGMWGSPSAAHWRADRGCGLAFRRLSLVTTRPLACVPGNLGVTALFVVTRALAEKTQEKSFIPQADPQPVKVHI